MDEKDPVVKWLTAHDGVGHTSSLRAEGIGKAAIATAVARGMVLRVRRSWLTAPDVDPRRAAAAAVSGRVTCVTQAELLKLWVPTPGATHIAVSSTASRLDPGDAVIHWGSGPSPVARTATPTTS
jgi:hypothetical protein